MILFSHLSGISTCPLLIFKIWGTIGSHTLPDFSIALVGRVSSIPAAT